MRAPFPALVLPLLLAGCPGDKEDSGACVPLFAVYTDIDETLTTADEEWMAQLMDPTHDPAMRPEADRLMQDYAARGYTIFYVTARGEDTSLSDGRTARQATFDWLQSHGFPGGEETVYLAPGFGVTGDDAVEYKAGVVDALSADGWDAGYAYGNADSDILAFQAAGIPDDRIFLVGELAGTMGVQPILDEEAYAAHREAWMPQVPEVACH